MDWSHWRGGGGGVESAWTWSELEEKAEGTI